MDEEIRTDQEIIDDEMLKIRQESEREVGRLAGARRIFALEHKAPVKKSDPEPLKITFWHVAGLRGALTTLGFVGVALISAMTVSLELYMQTAIYTNNMLVRIPKNSPGSGMVEIIVTYAPIVFLLCSWGFEMFIASYGFAEAVRKKVVDYQWYETVPAFSVMLLTGLSRSLPLDAGVFQPIVDLLRGFMELSTGVAAPLTAYYSARIFATFYNEWEERNNAIFSMWSSKQEENETEFNNKNVEYDDEFSKWYKGNAHKLFEGADRREKSYSDGRTKYDEDADPKINVTKAVWDFLVGQNLTPHQIGTKQGMVLTPEQVAEKLGLSSPKAKASVRKALQRARETYPSEPQ